MIAKYYNRRAFAKAIASSIIAIAQGRAALVDFEDWLPRVRIAGRDIPRETGETILMLARAADQINMPVQPREERSGTNG